MVERSNTRNNHWHIKCFKIRIRAWCARFRIFRMANMRETRSYITGIAFVVALLLGVAGLAEAQKRDEREIRDAVRALASKLDDFESNLRYQMQSSSANSINLSDAQGRIRGVRDAIRRFQENFDRKRDNRTDVNEIVTAARRVEDFLEKYPQNRRVEDDWRAARTQLDRLSSNYGLSNAWDPDDAREPQGVKDYPESTQFPGTGTTLSVGLSGTYDLDRDRSEKVDDVIADTAATGDQRDDLREKLTAPEQIAIDIRGNQITLATTNASPVTFTADGRDKLERDANGRDVRLRATLTGDKLVISSFGGETDYTITFISISDGRGMNVSRRITTDYLRQTVFAESVYNKTDSVAQLGIKSGSASTTYDPNGGYSDNDNSTGISNGGTGSTAGNNNGRGQAPTTVTAKPGNYVVPNGIQLTGTLDNEINTKISQNNDRFRLTVTSPDEFRGAVIEGYVSNIRKTGKVTGTSNVTFNFERIKLRNGQSYDFAGSLNDIRDSNGNTVKIDNEGTVSGGNKTSQTVKRSGIGAGIGAIIGAIAGGGKGAAIGAAIGGGAGAGSVIVRGEEDLRLMQGSTISVTSSSPVNIGTR